MKHIILFKYFSFILLAIIPLSGLSEKIVLHTVMDTQRNMPMHQIPLPASWELVTPKTIEDPSIIGPNGVKVYYRNGGSYVFSNDPYMQQIYSQSGQQMRPPISAQQIVEQDLAPQLNQHSLQLEKVYPLPEIAQRSQTYSNKLYQKHAHSTVFRRRRFRVV